MIKIIYFSYYVDNSTACKIVPVAFYVPQVDTGTAVGVAK